MRFGRARFARRCIAAAILTLAAAAAPAACGGDDDGGDGDGSPTAVPVQTAQLLPTVVIAGGTLTSAAWEYKAEFPETWTVSSNFIQSETAQGGMTPLYGGDALFAPESENSDLASSVRANIAIVCEESDITTIDELIAQKTDLLTTLGRQNIVVTDYADVAGGPAKKIEYDLARDDLRFEKAEVYFLTPRCARSVALTAQPGDRAKFTDELDRVLATFEVRE
jgi:hypothetical protein